MHRGWPGGPIFQNNAFFIIGEPGGNANTSGGYGGNSLLGYGGKLVSRDAQGIGGAGPATVAFAGRPGTSGAVIIEF